MLEMQQGDRPEWIVGICIRWPDRLTPGRCCRVQRAVMPKGDRCQPMRPDERLLDLAEPGAV